MKIPTSALSTISLEIKLIKVGHVTYNEAIQFKMAASVQSMHDFWKNFDLQELQVLILPQIPSKHYR